MYIEKIVSQIKNDLVSGLRGYHQNLSISNKQLEDEVVQTRLVLIHALIDQGKLLPRDLLVAINCVDVDCESLERCKCNTVSSCDTLVAHFQIPQLMMEFGEDSVEYIGSIDRRQRFTVVHTLSEYQLKKYRKRGKSRPYVWIDYAPNANGMLDCFLFNSPLVKQVSVVGVFKDPRQIEQYKCCTSSEYAEEGPDDNISFLTQQIKDTIVTTKLNYYRQQQAQTAPNDQQYRTGS